MDKSMSTTITQLGWSAHINVLADAPVLLEKDMVTAN